MTASEQQVTETLLGFAKADASQLGDRALLRRYDSKFLLRHDALLPFLASLSADYSLLFAGQSSIASYRTVYYDTPERTSYHDHARGRRPRTKIRIRHYAERSLSYLEIKTKSNHEQTQKARRKRTFNDETLTTDDHRFLAPHLRLDPGALSHSLVTDFRRITLLSLAHDERMTVDLDMSFQHQGKHHALPPAVLVEIKQGRFDRSTCAMTSLHKHRAHSVDFSKYCVSLALSGDVGRTHAFRPSIRLLERISNA